MKPTTLIALALTCSLILSGCNRSQKAKESTENKEKGSETEEVAIPVKIAKATRGSISSFLEFDSILETESAVEVSPESAGLVVKVLAEVGDKVEEGQMIAQLENEEQQVNLRESLSRYKHLQSKFQRTKDLFARNLINQQEYDTESFDLEQAEINYERSRLRLEDTIIRAPVAGVVSKRLTQLGERVNSNKVLFTLLNTNELFAQINVPGQHILSVQKGLKAEVVSEIIKGITYEASIKLVSPAIDPSSGTFNVKVALDNDDSIPVYPGMFVNVRIILDTKSNAVIIPKAAVVHEGEKTYIYKVKGNIVKKTLFSSGYSNADSVESMSDIKEGEQVIVLGHNSLKDGAKVNIVNDSFSAQKSEPEKATKVDQG